MTEPTLVGEDGHVYEWSEDWKARSTHGEHHTAFAHHALGVTADGRLVGFHPDGGIVVVFDPDGTVLRSFDCGLTEGHGMTVVSEQGEDFAWITDIGLKLISSAAAPDGYGPQAPHPLRYITRTKPNGVEIPWPIVHGRVIKVRLTDGAVVAELPVPELEAYVDGPYMPTSVAVAPDGCVWVADGYGANVLHRFDADGTLLLTLTGEESAAGRFANPHGIVVDLRRDEPELYVADRENRRLLVYDLDGGFRRELLRGQLVRPSGLALSGDLMVVAELRARVTLLDVDDQVVTHLGDDESVANGEGWPNTLVDGRLVRPFTLGPGRFNSPHGLAVDGDGNIYVSEWIIGGRYITLSPRHD